MTRQDDLLPQGGNLGAQLGWIAEELTTLARVLAALARLATQSPCLTVAASVDLRLTTAAGSGQNAADPGTPVNGLQLARGSRSSPAARPFRHLTKSRDLLPQRRDLFPCAPRRAARTVMPGRPRWQAIDGTRAACAGQTPWA